MLQDIEELLEPFMMIQRILEGQKYVTISFVPNLISVVRKQLQDKAVNARSEAVRTLAVDRTQSKGIKHILGIR
jgi:hypothetical protein